MYSIANSSNTTVPILDSDNYISGDAVFDFDQNASEFHMIMFIIICIAVLYIIFLIKYDYDQGSFIVLG